MSKSLFSYIFGILDAYWTRVTGMMTEAKMGNDEKTEIGL